MKTLLVTFLLSVAASAVADTTLTGKWQVHTRISDRETDWSCAFTQSGSDLSGTCSADAGSGNVTGKIDGRKVTWTHKFNSSANGPITLNFRGALNSATDITGSVNVEEYGVDGEFTATPSH